MFQHFDSDQTHQVLFLYIFPSHHLNLRDQHWRLQNLICWCRTDICSCKISAKLSLMLDNPFLVPSLYKLNISAFVSSRLSWNHLQTAYFLQRKQCFFWSHPRCFRPLGKFKHNIKISIKTARISRLSVSYDSAYIPKV